jgi:sugar phosphate isomerase/epimerase
MKLSISNIAWSSEYDSDMYDFLKEQEFTGLEIAPTRLFTEHPYNHIEEAKSFAVMLKTKYRLNISSVQSLWYGRNENIFSSEGEKEFLLDYTKQAVLFAKAIGCRNLVFGSPKNRNIPSIDFLSEAMAFFSEIGMYASENNAVIAFEPIPPIYSTNFINSTKEAFEMCRMINCAGLKVNVDLGTMIYYGEDLDFINSNIDLVNHIHISEPMLVRIEKREMHKQLKSLNYDGYFSIEMKNLNNINQVKDIAVYIKSILA